jgi:hypothetical protein
VERLPNGYEKADQIVSGLYRITNPYTLFQLQSGRQGGTDATLLLNHNNGQEGGSEEFLFAVIRQKNGSFLIFNASSGKALLPKGAAVSGYVPKVGDPMESSEYGGQEYATYTLKGLGLGRYAMCFRSNDRLAVTSDPHSGGPTTLLTVKEYNMEAEQQFEFKLVEAFKEVPLPPKVDKDAPAITQYSLLSFLGDETSPHKEISVNVPFYMVNDPEKSFRQKMKESPYYVVERKEYVKRMGGDNDGWKQNNGGSSIEFGNNRSQTQSSSQSTSVNANFSVSHSTEVGGNGILIAVTETITFTAELGFSSTWTNEYSTSVGSYEKYTVSPCSKGSIYSVANNITLKRKNGETVRTFKMFNKNSVKYVEIPLSPEECPTLRAQGEQKYNDAVVAYNNYVNKHHGGQGAIPITNTNSPAPATTTNSSTPAAIGEARPRSNQAPAPTVAPDGTVLPGVVNAAPTFNPAPAEIPQPDETEWNEEQNWANEGEWSDEESSNEEQNWDDGELNNPADGWGATNTFMEEGIVRIQSPIWPDYVIAGNAEGVGLVVSSNTETQANCTFRMHRVTDEGQVMFELAEFPGNYLQWAENRFVVGPGDGAGSLFNRIAGGNDLIYLEVTNYPGYYLMHGEQGVYIGPYEETQAYYSGAGFNIVPAQ